MDFSYSAKTIEWQQRMEAFFAEHILPNERRYQEDVEANTKVGRRWTPTAIIEELKPKAKAAGLWNLFMPGTAGEAGDKYGGC